MTVASVFFFIRKVEVIFIEIKIRKETSKTVKIYYKKTCKDKYNKYIHNINLLHSINKPKFKSLIYKN